MHEHEDNNVHIQSDLSNRNGRSKKQLLGCSASETVMIIDPVQLNKLNSHPNKSVNINHLFLTKQYMFVKV